MKQFQTQCYVRLETTRKESGKENHLSSFWQMTTTPPSCGEKAQAGLLGAPERTGAVTPQGRASREDTGAGDAQGPGPERCLPPSLRTSMEEHSPAQACREEQIYWQNETHSSELPAASVKTKEAWRSSRQSPRPRFRPSVPFKWCAKLPPSPLLGSPAVFQLHSRLTIQAQTSPASWLVLSCSPVQVGAGAVTALWPPRMPAFARSPDPQTPREGTRRRKSGKSHFTPLVNDLPPDF